MAPVIEEFVLLLWQCQINSQCICSAHALIWKRLQSTAKLPCSKHLYYKRLWLTKQLRQAIALFFKIGTQWNQHVPFLPIKIESRNLINRFRVCVIITFSYNRTDTTTTNKKQQQHLTAVSLTCVDEVSNSLSAIAVWISTEDSFFNYSCEFFNLDTSATFWLIIFVLSSTLTCNFIDFCVIWLTLSFRSEKREFIFFLFPQIL